MRRLWVCLLACQVLSLAVPAPAVADEEPGVLAPDIRLFRMDDAAPAYVPIGIVYEHRWNVSEAPPPTWRQVYDSAEFQARTLGADLVVEVSTGDYDPLVENGTAKWFLGIAATLAAPNADSLAGCDNCIVDWQPLDTREAGTDDAGMLAELERRAFAISRHKLGERGYYLRARSTARADAETGAPPAPVLSDRAYLTLQVAVRRGGAKGGSASSDEISFASRLTWNASGADAWKRSLSTRRSARMFDYVSGPDGVSSRTILVGLYGNLPKRGPTPDSDGDGVPDSRDQEANTPEGAEVTLLGIARDDDGDGVANGIDRDPRTPQGVMVDQWGVPVDADHDGVPDYLDRCPDTPADHAVDDQGCEIEEWVTILEDVLVDEGVLQERLEFSLGSAELRPEACARLDSIGVALEGLPSLRFRVDGHCDDLGDDEFNLRLSERRAQATIDYLVKRFSRLSPAQFVARGYGKSVPLAPGTDEVSRARNRRVEFVVENPQDARRQVEIKRFKRRGETAD